MTEQEMRILVPEKLKEIERNHNIKILFAAESGSRSWQVSAPDSDFDVRFIYVRHPKDYLRLDKVRDVLEFPISDGWDMSGWDLNKTLQLLYKSNPRLFEWFRSPIIYTDMAFADRFQPVMQHYFSIKNTLHHYLHTAIHQKDHFLQADMIKLKKYLYTLHPLMAAKWVLEKGTPPPVVFRELMAAELPEYMKEQTENLLHQKVTMPEMSMIQHIPAFDQYINQAIECLSKQAAQLPDEKEPDWDILNTFFLSELHII